MTLAGFAADQISKAWAASAGPGLDGLLDLVPGLLAVAPAENTGALASLAGDSAVDRAALRGGGLVLAGCRSPGRGPRGARPASACAGLLGAGLLGNSADRLGLGHVRDFLVSGLFPRLSFNLADVFLVAGALALIAARNNGPRMTDD